MRSLFRDMMKWPRFLLAFMLFSAAGYMVLEYYLKMGWIAVAVMVLGVLAYLLVWRFVLKNKMNESVVAEALEVSDLLQKEMEELSYPYLLLDPEGRILWLNRAMTAVLQEISPDAERPLWFKDVFPQTADWNWESLCFSDEGAAEMPPYLTLGDQVFAIKPEGVESEPRRITVLLSNETVHLRTLVELENERNVSGLIYVDNFEEMIKSTEAEKQSLLSAIIEQRITKYFQNFNGIVCRTERDRFFISIDTKGLTGCREDRFSLLKDVKNIKMGNTVPVTLSIAFGCAGESYEDNLKGARSAMDLALARGGDQVVVKTGEEVEYFGGKNLGEAAQTRVKARVMAQALKEIMAGKEQIFVMGHKLGDNDSFGAAVAMYRLGQTLHKDTYLVLDEVSFSVRPLWQCFQVDPNYPRNMFLSGEEALQLVGDNALVVVVDVNRASLTECPGLLEKTDQVVVFDHHRQSSAAIPAILSYVEPYASSACEMIAEIMQYFGENGVKLRPLEANAIYSGILVDTNNFSDRTSARTFEAAAYLKRSGADLVEVKKLLREDFAEFRAKADATVGAEIFRDVYAMAECRAEGLDSPTVIGSQAANELLNIAGIKASFVFTQVDEVIYVSARSIDEVNVQLICERLGGGGHLSAAGVQFTGLSVAEAKLRIKETIESMTKEGALS